jgi:hypothetical protein
MPAMVREDAHSDAVRSVGLADGKQMYPSREAQNLQQRAMGKHTIASAEMFGQFSGFPEGKSS